MDFFIFISEQWVLVSVLMLLIYTFAFTEQRKAGKQLSVHELTRLLNQDQAVLIDLRDAKDFGAGHITGALNVPFGKVDERMAEFEKYREQDIVLVDKLGQHSASTGRKLRRAGFQVQRLRGGMSEWQQQSLPLVSG